MTYLGGENSGVQYSYNSETGYPTTTISVASWESSVNEKNGGIIDIDWQKTIPIYNLIADPLKRSLTMSAVKSYMTSKEIQEYAVRPIYRVYKDAIKNTSICTTVEALNYAFSLGYVKNTAKQPIQKFIQGCVFADQIPGTLPLYRIYKRDVSNTSCCTTQEELDFFYSKGYVRDDRNPALQFILGYIYATPHAGTKPFYRMYRDDIVNTTFTSSEAEVVFFKSVGYVPNNANPVQKYIQGYVLPYYGE